MIFRTARLVVRNATDSQTDISVFQKIWADKKIMKNVGFPEGIHLSDEEIRQKILSDKKEPFDSMLLAQFADSGEIIGECRMGSPDKEGISDTDIKLLPDFQGMGLGTELKLALADFIFRNSECKGIRATPNVNNAASIRMQEKAGAEFITEGSFNFPALKHKTCEVHYKIYILYRKTWEENQKK